MTDLVDTTEMYLRTILDLEEEEITPLRARISERLGHSGPTVSQTIARMERDGLVRVEGDRHLSLTVEGRTRALHVMRKHRLAERLLADVIGLDWAYVHDEACRWEHVMSEQVERRLLELLDHPTESPYGNPIPALDELGDAPAGRFLEGVVNIVDRTAGTSAAVAGVTVTGASSPAPTRALALAVRAAFADLLAADLLADAGDSALPKSSLRRRNTPMARQRAETMLTPIEM